MSDKSKGGSWFGRHKILTVILVFVALGVIGAAAGGGKTTSNNTSTPAAPDKTASTSSSSSSTQQAATKPAPTPQVLLDLTGSGTKQTQKFTAAGDWDLNWSYDCSSFGSQGNFVVDVYNSDGTINYDNSGVNQLGASGSDVQHYYKGGTFYLNINSECNWHVTAKG